MGKVRVLIIEDSAFMRKVIQEYLVEDERIQVIGFARNGQDGIDKIKKMKPDVVTLDVEMPIMNGLEALQIIMEECPLPVVMLSSSTAQGAENTLLAIQYGAVDFISKPSGNISLDMYKIKEELVAKIIAAGQVNVACIQKSLEINKGFIPKSEKNGRIEPSGKLGNSSVLLKEAKKIIAIGTSTGGPRALQCVLSKLPKEIEAPIFVVQHMPAGFTKSLANRLNNICAITVKEATNGEVVQKGTAYIAPGGYHLTVKQFGKELRVVLDQSAAHNGHRPSVDTLFESIGGLSGFSTIAVIMTGMGSDGSKGLVAMKSHSSVISIAESETSSIVFGMPKAAIATNLVDVVEDVENIAHAIMKYF